MLKRKHFDVAASLVERLLDRQRRLNVPNPQITRETGIGHGAFSRWRLRDSQPTLKTFVAVADALGMEVVLRERQP
jgi:DNA-binding phage protein